MLSAWRGFYRYLTRDHGYASNPCDGYARQNRQKPCRTPSPPTRPRSCWSFQPPTI